MNKRIIELAKQSGYNHPKSVGTSEIYAYFDHEKFAELIVRECIDIIKEDKRINWNDSINLIDAIKDNFGVES